jgi:integrase
VDGLDRAVGEAALTRSHARSTGLWTTPEYAGLYDVRHTYATLARDSGINGKIVTDRLGHANETVTQQIYTHRSTGQDREAAETIASLIADALSAQP